MYRVRHLRLVSTHSRLKAAVLSAWPVIIVSGFNTQPPEGGCPSDILTAQWLIVSTHSRLKAADRKRRAGGLSVVFQHTAA